MLELLLQNLVNGVLMGCVYALVALGLALQFGVMDIINFAHGEFVMIAMYLVFWISLYLAIPGSLTSLIVAPIYFVFGLVVYKLVIDRIVGTYPLAQIAATIGLMVLLRNLALAAWRAQPRGLQYEVLRGSVTLGPVVVPISRLTAALVSVGTMLALHWFLTHTRLGLALRATSDDMQAASFLGINVRKMFALAFGLGCAIIGIAAAFIMTFQQVNPESGLTWGLISWIIVVMAGLGGVSGVLLSGLILGLVEALEITFWDPRASLAVMYSLFILILWVKPRGLFGRR